MIKLRNLNFENHPEITENVLYLSKSEISRMNRDESENVTYITMKNNDFPSYNVVETPEEILAMPDIETTKKVIDWEQRRYEMAKEMLGYIYRLSWDADIDDMSPSTIAEEAAKYADALIHELKKGQGNEN